MRGACRVLLLAVGVLSGAGVGPPAAPAHQVSSARPAAVPAEQPSHPAASHRLPLAVAPARPPVADHAPDGRAASALVATIPALASGQGIGRAAPPRTADRRAGPTYLQYYPTAPPART